MALILIHSILFSTETISMVRAMNRFPGGDHPSQLSFNKGQIIYVKSKAKDENIWEGEVSYWNSWNI